MARYSDEERTQAVLFLEAAGYPDKHGALATVSKRLGIPHSTLSRWFRKKQNPPPSKMVQEKRVDLVAAIRAELAAILEEMNFAREDADYRALATAFGIMVDKLQLLTGEPTETQEQRIKVERHGINTIPQHLARQPGADTGGVPALQRGGLRAEIRQDAVGH